MYVNCPARVPKPHKMWQHASRICCICLGTGVNSFCEEARSSSALSRVLGYAEYVVGIRKEESCVPQWAFRWQAPRRARSSQSAWWWASCRTNWRSSPSNPTTPWTARARAGMAMKMSMITCHALPVQTCEKSVLIAAVSEDSRRKKKHKEAMHEAHRGEFEASGQRHRWIKVTHIPITCTRTSIIQRKHLLINNRWGCATAKHFKERRFPSFESIKSSKIYISTSKCTTLLLISTPAHYKIHVFLNLLLLVSISILLVLIFTTLQNLHFLF